MDEDAIVDVGVEVPDADAIVDEDVVGVRTGYGDWTRGEGDKDVEGIEGEDAFGGGIGGVGELNESELVRCGGWSPDGTTLREVVRRWPGPVGKSERPLS